MAVQKWPLSIYHRIVSRVGNQRKAFVKEGQQIYTKTQQKDRKDPFYFFLENTMIKTGKQL